MFLLDMETRKFLLCNARCSQLLGYGQEEFLRLEISDIHPPDELPIIFEEIAKFMKGEEGVRHDVRFRRKDGSIFFSDLSPSLVTLAGKRALLLVYQDISERKRTEAERERLLADLKAKNKEMEAFVYTVSHDLKSPLVSLGGFSSALKKEYESQLGEEGKHYLERIQANIVQMGNLITNLLEVSRLGRALGPIEEIDVAALLRQIEDALAIRLKEVGAEFVVLEPLPIVRADRSSIYQVFVNLIVNAVKFRGMDRALRIEVGCRQESGFYRFHVADNGIGIGPENHEQIFAPFQKLHLEIEGAGIGLTLVKKIVENHGGRVWVESPSTSLRAGNQGAGATFYFTLPMERRTHPHG
jgi:PAS domain S-box-containing protein